MIRPVDALAPKVLFKGQIDDSRKSRSLQTKKRIALVNAAGISSVTGGLTTVIARSYTSNWKHAGMIGVGASAVAMMFIGPQFLYKSGFNTTKKQNDVPKKIITNVNEAIDSKLGNAYAKLARKAVI